MRVESLWDLVLIYDELLDALGLDSAARRQLVRRDGGLRGRSAPSREGRQARPARPDRPVARRRAGRALHDDAAGRAARDAVHSTRCRAVQDVSRAADDPDELAVALADSVWALGATGKFVWPIPDKGLDRRLHRVTAPTLIVWGERRPPRPAVYAEEFADRIADSRVEIVAGAGHVPQWERLETVAPLVLDFLADA